MDYSVLGLVLALLAFQGVFLTWTWQQAGKPPWVTPTLQEWRNTAWLLTPFMALYGAGFLLEFQEAQGLLYFIGAFLISWLLDRQSWPTQMKSASLLIVVIGLAWFLPTHEIALRSTLFGLLASLWVSRPPAAIMHRLPAALWLAGYLWIDQMVASHQQSQFVILLLAGFITYSGLLLLQPVFERLKGPILTHKVLQVVVPSMISALAFSVLLNTSKPLPHLWPWALLFAGGLAVAQMARLWLNGTPTSYTRLLAHRTVLLILLGLGTLIASRLFNSFGWLVLAIGALFPITKDEEASPSIFWTILALFQCYLMAYNTNVTGINLMHAYVTAGLYAGLISALVLPNVMTIWAESGTFIQQRLGLWLSLGLPILAGLFFHVEPTASFVLAFLIGSIGLYHLRGLFQVASLAEGSEKQQSVLSQIQLMPLMLIVTAWVSGECLALGETLTRTDRLWTLLGLVLALLGILLINRWRMSRQQPIPIN